MSDRNGTKGKFWVHTGSHEGNISLNESLLNQGFKSKLTENSVSFDCDLDQFDGASKLCSVYPELKQLPNYARKSCKNNFNLKDEEFDVVFLEDKRREGDYVDCRTKLRVREVDLAKCSTKVIMREFEWCYNGFTVAGYDPASHTLFFSH